MINAPNVRGPRRTIYTLHNKAIQPHVEERYMRRVEQLERWRIEYQQSLAREEKLAVLSNFEYEEIDYTPLLERTPYKARPFPNYNYLIDEATALISNKYILPLTLRGLALLVIALMLVVSFNAVTLWIAVSLGAVGSISLYFTLLDRQRAMSKAVEQAKTTIQQRIEDFKKQAEQEKRVFEAKEQERIDSVKRLLLGDHGSVILKIDEVFKDLKLPVPVKLTVDLFHNTPLFTIMLPHKDVIPPQACSLQTSGKISYTEKDPVDLNKQYIELCAAIVVQIICICYKVIPSFDSGYVNAMMKDGLEDSCVVSASFTRNDVKQMCNAKNAMSALGIMQAKFKCDHFSYFQPIEVIQPDGWEGVDPKDIRSITINIDG